VFITLYQGIINQALYRNTRIHFELLMKKPIWPEPEDWRDHIEHEITIQSSINWAMT